MNNDLKVVIGMIVATVLLIGGGAYFMGQKGIVSTAPDALLSSETVSNDLLLRPDRPSKGAEQAAVTIVEFGDFQCPACSAVAPLLAHIVDEQKDVRVVYRHYPLREIHPHAQAAAEAAEAAREQGKFWEMHDLLFQKQGEWASAGAGRFAEYARELGMNVERFNASRESGAQKNRVDEDRRDGNTLKITGTPTLYLNGRLYTGRLVMEDLRAAVEQVRSGR